MPREKAERADRVGKTQRALTRDRDRRDLSCARVIEAARRAECVADIAAKARDEYEQAIERRTAAMRERRRFDG